MGNTIKAKPTMSEFLDETLYDIEGFLEKLDWTYNKEGEGIEAVYDNIICSCGNAVEICGSIGVDYVMCPVCHKMAQDMTGLIRTGNAVVTYLDTDQVDLSDRKVWAVRFKE